MNDEKIATGIKYCPLCNTYYSIIVTWESFWEYYCKCKNCNSQWILKRRGYYTADWYLILSKSDDNGIGSQYVNDKKTFSFWKNFTNLSINEKKKKKKKLKPLNKEDRDYLIKLYKNSDFNNIDKNLKEINKKIQKLRSDYYDVEELDWMLD